jgi:hypothetical protein
VCRRDPSFRLTFELEEVDQVVTGDS